MIEGIFILDLLEGNLLYAAGWFTSGDNKNIKEERQKKKNLEAMVVDRNCGNSVPFKGIRI